MGRVLPFTAIALAAGALATYAACGGSTTPFARGINRIPRSRSTARWTTTTTASRTPAPDAVGPAASSRLWRRGAARVEERAAVNQKAFATRANGFARPPILVIFSTAHM